LVGSLEHVALLVEESVGGEMKVATSAFLFFWLVGTGSAQGQAALCPRHIETPSYSPMARMANVTGEVVLQVTIDAQGNVADAKATNTGTRVSLLERGAIENVWHWTFTKPPSAPYTETITYDYEFDLSLPGYDGSPSRPVITKVRFDLPDHVIMATNAMMVEPSQPRTHR
jgi:TonB family protein